MKIIESEKQLEQFISKQITKSSYTILIDAYYPGKEVEVDVVTDGQQIMIPAIFEHIEKAGVHSGDSMAVTPPISLSESMKEQIVTYAERVAQGMNFKGIFNIQFVIYEDVLYVLEVNPRASRTVPIISKVTSVDMIELATGTLLGKSLASEVKLLPESDFYAVKSPVFSTTKLPGVDPLLEPEMKSTGEVIAISSTYAGSITKALIRNEQLQQAWEKEAKEIYMDVDNIACKEELMEQFNLLHITVKTMEDLPTFTEVEAWMKTDAAFAVICTDPHSAVRERAQEFELMIMSSEETALASARMTTDKLAVHVIQQLQQKHQKEVVLQ